MDGQPGGTGPPPHLCQAAVTARATGSGAGAEAQVSAGCWADQRCPLTPPPPKALLHSCVGRAGLAARVAGVFHAGLLRAFITMPVTGPPTPALHRGALRKTAPPRRASAPTGPCRPQPRTGGGAGGRSRWPRGECSAPGGPGCSGHLQEDVCVPEQMRAHVCTRHCLRAPTESEWHWGLCPPVCTRVPTSVHACWAGRACLRVSLSPSLGASLSLLPAPECAGMGVGAGTLRPPRPSDPRLSLLRYPRGVSGQHVRETVNLPYRSGSMIMRRPSLL